jgi:hypothetical protein
VLDVAVSSPTAGGQYCVLAHDAVRLLNQRGYRASCAIDGALEWRIEGCCKATVQRDGSNLQR